MTPEQTAFAATLTRFSDASERLSAAVREERLTDDVVRAAVDAATEARLAFERMVLAGFERARARGWR